MNNATGRKMTDDEGIQLKNKLIIDEIHPIKERLVGMEKTVEHHEAITKQRFDAVDNRMDQHDLKLDRIESKGDATHDLVKKMWNYSRGMVSAAAIIWAVVEFAVPLFKLI